jgi:hypothetical protein
VKAHREARAVEQADAFEADGADATRASPS